MLSPRPPVHSPSGVSASFSRRSLSPAGRPRGGRSSRTPHLARCTLTQTLPRFSTPGRCVPPGRDSLCGLQAERRAPRCVHCSRPGSEFNLTHSVRLPVLIPPPPPRFPGPSLSPARSARRLPLPRSLGSRDGGAVRQAQPPAPMAARRSQRRRGRRGEPGTALLAPLVLGLGLALACLGLLLAVVSLGSRASLSAQVRPACTPLPGQIRSGLCRVADGAGWAEGRGPGRWVAGEMSGGEGQGDAASFPAGAFPGGPGGRGGPRPAGEWGWVLASGCQAWEVCAR